jgi:hypothetical protein
MKDNVVAQVSQHSREAGRTPVHVLAERLEKERKDLIAEKLKIEQELGLLSADKNEAMSRRGYGGYGSVAQNCARVSAEFGHKRAELVAKKQAIEERMLRIKATMAEKQMHGKNYPDVVILERIEGLLIRLCRKLDA